MACWMKMTLSSGAHNISYTNSTIAVPRFHIIMIPYIEIWKSSTMMSSDFTNTLSHTFIFFFFCVVSHQKPRCVSPSMGWWRGTWSISFEWCTRLKESTRTFIHIRIFFWNFWKNDYRIADYFLRSLMTFVDSQMNISTWWRYFLK